jgi:hypothetical protein
VSAEMHLEAAAADKRCGMCHSPFRARTPWQSFCSTRCRTAFAVEHGTEGQVSGVRKVKNGVNVVVHFEGPSAEHALKLLLRESVRLLRALTAAGVVGKPALGEDQEQAVRGDLGGGNRGSAQESGHDAGFASESRTDPVPGVVELPA